VKVSSFNTKVHDKLNDTSGLPYHFRLKTENLFNFADRFKEVIIENRPADEIIKIFDSRRTLFYLDPPYPLMCRTNKRKYYGNELNDDDHLKLADQLNNVSGMAVISGYRCDLYDTLYKEWTRFDKETLNMNNKKRIESIWLSPNTVRKNTIRLF
jgi:DNA adenine methylase